MHGMHLFCLQTFFKKQVPPNKTTPQVLAYVVPRLRFTRDLMLAQY